uniref:Uncharacterized protein n=1 Tax=Mesocestoides corti TaxID=53468 RepID=A0A5K3EUR5_MESCO
MINWLKKRTTSSHSRGTLQSLIPCVMLFSTNAFNLYDTICNGYYAISLSAT